MQTLVTADIRHCFSQGGLPVESHKATEQNPRFFVPQALGTNMCSMSEMKANQGFGKQRKKGGGDFH